MADNFPLTAGSGRNAATDEVTHSGDTADVQLVRPVLVAGSEGSKTVVDLTGDNANGLDVDVTRLPALVAGSAAIGRVGHDITGIGHGVTTVTTAGTDVALAGSTTCKRVIIQAQTDNTNSIAVGASGVDATVATGNGILLDPGDSIDFEIDNLADVFIDSLVNGEGVRYTYFT